MNISIFLAFLACSGKTSPPPTESPEKAVAPVAKAPPAPQPKAPFPPGQIRTNEMLETGILSPIPESIQAGESISVEYKMLLPNGCWSLSTVQSEVSEFAIHHTLNKNFEEGKVCTMAMRPAGFVEELKLVAPGSYTGKVIINDEQVLSYTVEVRSSASTQ